ncbi:MAG: response regulator [Proteobacteria bacterium]|nr:response regulator [Pseudomonadota bacterium]MBU1234044.1 response regulator [Pseudomonadota bacterium]MBU1417998.1 response regulator [Pseudomonadota bacterium]MBU1455951.1 response regulator [Pseudomonadota bacterium]
MSIKMTNNMISASVNNADLSGADESILIVDDERMQRDLLSKLLNVLGYAATAVASGEEAVTFLRTHQVNLVMLDMCMTPGMNGRQTFEAILKLHPEQKVIIVSGYSDSEEISKSFALGAKDFVRKPYTIAELGQAVKRGLSS